MVKVLPCTSPQGKGVLRFISVYRDSEDEYGDEFLEVVELKADKQLKERTNLDADDSRGSHQLEE